MALGCGWLYNRLVASVYVKDLTMPDRPIILIIEDDEHFSRLMSTFLKSEGFEVLTESDGLMGKDKILDSNPDLAIIDMMLPGMSGIEICYAIKEHFSNPVMMLTAQDEEMLEVAALNEGFDDYLIKPVRPHVLKARINALLRRHQKSAVSDGLSNQDSVSSADEALKVQDVMLSRSRHEVSHNGVTLALNSLEFKLLEVLMGEAGRAIDRDTLYQRVKGVEYNGLDRSIDTAVSHLRKKLNDNDPPYRYLKTLRGHGYLFVPD